MDGFSQTLSIQMGSTPMGQAGSAWVSRVGRPQPQRTLRNPIGCVGVGLHSGRKVSLRLAPAPVGSGIVFHRADLGGVAIPARFDRVVDTRLCTVLGHGDARVGTTEHLLAALAGCGLTNAVVTLDGPEVPILDGSAASFVFLIDCAGIVEQDAAMPAIEILRPVRVQQGEAFAELLPGGPGLDMTLSIDFAAAAIGAQTLSIALSPESFRATLASARTFTQADEVAALRQAGLALGGSLDNAIVVDGDRILNPGGLRSANEFVRHKLLDAVGDLALTGAALQGRFVGHRSGHALNNQLLRAVFADDANWAPIAGDVGGHGLAPIGGGWPTLRVAAAAA